MSTQQTGVQIVLRVMVRKGFADHGKIEDFPT